MWVYPDWHCYLDRYDDLKLALGWNNTEQAKIHFEANGLKEGIVHEQRMCICMHGPALLV